MSHTAANRILFGLSLVGCIVALVLTVYHGHVRDLPCGESRGCDIVNTHPTASGFGIRGLEGIPTAAFGLLMYAGLAVLSVVRIGSDGKGAARLAGLLQWLLAAGGTLVSAWLTYLEAYVIHAWCKWCVASAIIVVLIFVTATLENVRPAPRTQGELT